MFPIQPLSQLFGVSMSLASETFNMVCIVMVAASYDQYVTLPKRDEGWQSGGNRKASLRITSFCALVRGMGFPYM